MIIPMWTISFGRWRRITSLSRAVSATDPISSGTSVEVVAENEPSLRLEAAHVQTDDPAPAVEQRPHHMRSR